MVAMKKVKVLSDKKDLRRAGYLQLLIGIGFVVAVNLIGHFLFYRLDLTAEKRYSLSPVTRKVLKDLDDVVYFKIYLEGEFPAGFTRLRNETREMLNQFKAYSPNIEYEFIDPSASGDANARDALYRQLVQSGLNPTELQVNEKSGLTQKFIFPGAIVSYKSSEVPVQLLGAQQGQDPALVLNNSVEGLEFNLVNAIKKLTSSSKPQIAFLQGQGELSPLLTAGAQQALSEYYGVERIQINGQLNALQTRRPMGKDSSEFKITNKYAAIIVAKPDSLFGKDERDKFILDQYIMRGGKVLWLVDGVKAEMDSLAMKPETVGLSNEVNLTDMLFNYGARINNNLIIDLNALPVPIVVDNQGTQKYYPWLFFPLLTPTSQHPIVRNLNAIKTEFVSSLDTTDAPGIRKTILLASSQYSRLLSTPVMIKLAYLRQQPNPKAFNMPYQPVALLLEGEFVSLFLNRVPAEIASAPQVGFVEKSQPTAMIVVSDGDVIKNQLAPGETGASPLPLGYDRHTRQQFGNNDFILNCVSYLVEGPDLLSLRSRKVTLRELDKPRVEENRLQWQLLNTLVPVALVALFGLGMAWYRKRKYAGK